MCKINHYITKDKQISITDLKLHCKYKCYGPAHAKIVNTGNFCAQYLSGGI